MSPSKVTFVTCFGVAAFIAAAAFARSGSSPDSPAQESGRTLVMDNLTAQTSTTSGSMVIYTVPANKILVIENLFGRASAVPGNAVYGSIRTKYMGEYVDSWVVFDAQSTTSQRTTWTFNHPAKLYAGAGTTVEMRVSFKTATANSSFTGGFAGYLIDKP